MQKCKHGPQVCKIILLTCHSVSAKNNKLNVESYVTGGGKSGTLKESVIELFCAYIKI